MAIVKLNPLCKRPRVAFGDLVLKQYGDKTVLSRKPDFTNRTFTEAQKACHERFRQATLFAKQLMADPRARKVYEEEARVKRKPILSLMIADFLNSPSQHDIGTTADVADTQVNVNARCPNEAHEAYKNTIVQGFDRGSSRMSSLRDLFGKGDRKNKPNLRGRFERATFSGTTLLSLSGIKDRSPVGWVHTHGPPRGK